MLETCNPPGAVTVTLADKLLPETVKLVYPEAEPTYAESAEGVPLTVSKGEDWVYVRRIPPTPPAPPALVPAELPISPPLPPPPGALPAIPVPLLVSAAPPVLGV